MRWWWVALVGCGGRLGARSVEMSECLTGDSADTGASATLEATGEAGGIHVSHAGVALSCCIDRVDVGVSASGTHLDVTYTERGTPCDCMCAYDLTYDLVNVSSGAWTVDAAGDSAQAVVP